MSIVELLDFYYNKPMMGELVYIFLKVTTGFYNLNFRFLLLTKNGSGTIIIIS